MLKELKLKIQFSHTNDFSLRHISLFQHTSIFVGCLTGDTDKILYAFFFSTERIGVFFIPSCSTAVWVLYLPSRRKIKNWKKRRKQSEAIYDDAKEIFMEFFPYALFLLSAMSQFRSIFCFQAYEEKMNYFTFKRLA